MSLHHGPVTSNAGTSARCICNLIVLVTQDVPRLSSDYGLAD
jgi:hypothetical protein